MKRLLTLLTLAGFCGTAQAQQGPMLLKDINTQNVAPGAYNIDPASFCSLNGLTYFSGYTPNFGRQLWQTDGTSAGTRPLTHTPALSWTISGSSIPEIPSSLTAMNGELFFFTANAGANGSSQNSYNLMKSDVNGNITLLATSAQAGAGGQLTSLLMNSFGDPARRKMVMLNNNLLFAFSDAQHGIELWKSDGTAAGTQMLADLMPGLPSASSQPANFTANSSYVFFTATNPSSNALDLWRTDGSAGGTIKLRDSISVGTTALGMVVVNNKFYCLGNRSNGYNVWESDGTVAGTKSIANGPGSLISQLMKQGNNLIYFLNPTDGLMKYDGTSSVQLSATAYPFAAVSRSRSWADVNGTLFFSARSTGSYRSIWKTDGTSAGTVKVKDTIIAGNYFNANGTLYFAGDDSSGHGLELWRSNGTGSFTRLSDFNTNAGVYNGSGIIDVIQDYTMTMQGGKVLLSAFNGTTMATGTYNSVLAVSDGTAAGTTMLAPPLNATYDSYLAARMIWNNTLYFSAYEPTHGYELWKTDGTPGGTVFMRDIVPGPQSSYISGFMPYNGKLYFCTSDTSVTLRSALWSTDGTSAGTVKVKDSLGNSRYVISKLDTLNGQLIVVTNGAVYKSDGTAAGTTRIPTLAPGASVESACGNYAFLNGQMIATARGANSTFGPDEVWKIDLAANTATWIANGQIVGSYGEMKTFRNAVYFVKERATNQFNFALWKTDGTAAGTVIVDTSYLPRHLELFDNNTSLYYTTSSSGGNRSNLRRITSASLVPQTVKSFSDATTGLYAYYNTYSYYSFSGPQSAATLYDNAYPLYPYFIRVNSASPIFFPGGDSTWAGVELMQTDGTTANTTLVKDILSGVRSGNIQYLTHMLNKQGDSILVFVAGDETEGNEIWVSDGTAAGTKSLTHTMGGTNTMNPQSLIWLNNRLIFWGSRTETGYEPYVYELNEVLDAPTVHTNNTTLALYPNPASQLLNVISPAAAQLSIFDLAGSKRYEQEIGAGVAAVPVSQLAPGIYLVRVADHAGRIRTGKFVKQ